MKPAVILVIVFLIGSLTVAGCTSGPAGQPPPSTTPVPAEEKPHYTIGIDADYPPFTYRDSEGNFTGFDIESARWIADREGFDVEFVAVPWDAIIPTLQSGTIDMIYSGISITPDREKEVNFTIPYYTVTKSVAVRSGSNITLEDLYNGRLRVGTQSGSSAETWIEDTLIEPGSMPASNLVLYPNLSAVTEGLMSGSFDASIIDTPSQLQLISGKPLVILGEIPTADQYAVAVRKTDPELLATMNDGLRQLMADPYWQQLLQKYGL
jgi:polar amino acid transport system substrate-binding protein